MKLANNRLWTLLAITLALSFTGPASAFNLDSDLPITVSADNARLDDAQGIATYNGDVELVQGRTRLTAERVVLYRNAEGLSRIEASGKPARYQQPTRNGEGETDARALNITWSADENRLTFEREAIIEQNGNLFRGDVIHYDTVRRVVTAEGGTKTETGSGRVEMVIQPRSTGGIQGSDGSSESQ
ncbi:lipopolysaccharide transport periplasmic protein LptA [Marinobacter sp. F4206]|uniref:lipopolysaccharide transport periplasmic protein LptA n=1 Tax=Marinobacter sp. F4206 TaxID=2861777 RepID=UPI001C5CD728|nr:lipopolysaccharide transport periplasmic protein LptA [Marinobacter sp. F4206]MBW4933845.1 lipopolysaccharide transport periplasmic protein LptA [Marinobacter sp. F4206]